METASFVISIIAAVFAGGAVWYARGQKAAADRSARASEQSAQAAIQSADAAHETVGYQRADVERSRVVFVLEYVGSAAHLLSNTGTDPAYGVHVDTGDLGIGGEVTDYDVFGPGQTEEVLLSPSLASTTTHVEVSWHQQPDRSNQRRTVRLYAAEA
jgi:hypothetical protein